MAKYAVNPEGTLAVIKEDIRAVSIYDDPKTDDYSLLVKANWASELLWTHGTLEYVQGIAAALMAELEA